MKDNIILQADSYKASQWVQYPEDTVAISSYIEARGGEKESVFFGLQAFIKEHLLTPITAEMILEAQEIITAHGEPFNLEGWEIILNEYDGYIPVTIQAVPEGTVMPTKNVQVQVTNNDPRLYWVTSYIETALLRAVWYPSTVATKSRKMKLMIADALEKTSDIPVEDQIGFKLHDFGARGATTSEAAMLGGMGHLVNFMGTDTMEALIGARRYYGENIAGFSIPASEHSTMTSWGRENEKDAYSNMIDQFAGDGKIYACVSDSYNIWEAIKMWGSMKDKIIEQGGTLVVRPDSGDPVATPIKVVEALMDEFGYTTNSKGFRVLPDCVRVIQGDGITEESLDEILRTMVYRKLSIDNIAFGMGGGLLQKWDRDTLKYAMKASARQDVNGVWHDVYKDPIGGGKTSKKGRLALVNAMVGHEGNGDPKRELMTVREDSVNQTANVLCEVYKNGQLLVDDDFATIRERASI